MAGNLTDDGQRSLTWNSRGQLSKVTQGSDETVYAYDAFGRRRATTAGGTTTKVTYYLVGLPGTVAGLLDPHVAHPAGDPAPREEA